MRIGAKLCLLVVGATLLATAVLTGIGSVVARRQYLAGVDRQLTTAAAALPAAIGEDYLAGALAGRAPDAAQYSALVDRLSLIADDAGVFYVYAFTRRGDQIVHLATSASAAERAGGGWPTFLQPYEEPPPELLATLADGRTRFADYTDEFGTFRSVFVRHADAGGRAYVIGVDVTLDEIRRHLAALVWWSLLAGVVVAGATGAAGVLTARRIARPLATLSREIAGWAGRDFAVDPATRAPLLALASRHRDEAGELAARFVEVEDRLERFLRELAATSAAKERIEQQLEVARGIQQGLLPRDMPRIQNFEVTGWSKPADQTGGDYFDWIPLPDGRLALTIADVTGHGIGPALLAAAARAYTRATLVSDRALDNEISRLNDLLHLDMAGASRFVTLVACMLDPVSRHMKLVAAGHGPIMFFSRRLDRLDTSIESHGPPLGVMDRIGYERPMEFGFEPGDVLVLVSDGFYEWPNPDGKLFGTERLRQSVETSCREAPDQIIERLRRDLDEFRRGRAQTDDTTAIVVRCIA